MLDESGIGYLRGAVDVTAIEDAIWDFYAGKGVLRDDPTTWPVTQFQTKLQQLRKAGVFKPFGNAVVDAAIGDVLGEGWYQTQEWGGALVSFPVEGTWAVPKAMWHADVRPKGSPDRAAMLRMFGFVSPVGPQGGGTLVIEGSHEVIRRKVAASPDNDAGSSAQVKKQLFREHPWFRAPDFDGTEVDGVYVRVRELTGEPGDVVFMLPWTLHNISMNCSARPRFMVTHTVFAKGVHAPSE